MHRLAAGKGWGNNTSYSVYIFGGKKHRRLQLSTVKGMDNSFILETVGVAAGLPRGTQRKAAS